MKIITRHCPNCGSENIVREAWVSWNVQQQDWEIYDFVDHDDGGDTRCNDCIDVFGCNEIVSKEKGEAA